MKKLTIILVTLFLPLAGLLAQDVYINPADPAFREKYKSIDLEGKFSMLAVSDNDNNYYIVDFAQLAGKFEKVYFLNLVFRSDKVVNIDPDLKQDRIWFLAVKTTKEQTVHEYLLDLKKKTETAAAGYTEAEKEQWLQKNDKYK